MRKSLDNPFQPGSDVVPAVWVGRSEQLADWQGVVRPRLRAGQSERGRTIVGEPGVGKSTLVRRIAENAEADGDWTTRQIRIAVGTDPLKRVAEGVLGLADRAGLPAGREQRIQDLLTRVRSIAVSGVSLQLGSIPVREPHADLTELIVEVGRAAIRHDRVVLIHVDEIQNITDPAALSQLLIALVDAITMRIAVEAPGGVSVERSIPVAVYLTGLPEFLDSAGARSVATFARRFMPIYLDPLDEEDLRGALSSLAMTGWEVPDEDGGTTRVRLEPGAIDAILEACQGEPFLFQLAGERAWYAGTGDVITRDEVLKGWRLAVPEATAHVQRVLDRLPAREREFVEAMASLPPGERTLTTISAAAGFARSSAAGPTSQRLDVVRGIIGRGRLYTFRHRALEAYLTSDWPNLGEAARA